VGEREREREEERVEAREGEREGERSEKEGGRERGAEGVRGEKCKEERIPGQRKDLGLSAFLV
jgi:hypothetical protein